MTNLVVSITLDKNKKKEQMAISMVENIKDRPYWMYNAVLDSRTRPSHRALHGKVFRADDPIWDKIYPPNGWNCRCTVIPLDQEDLNELNIKPEELNPVKRKKLLSNFIIDKGWDYNPGKAALEFDRDFGTFELYNKQPDYSHFNRPNYDNIEDNMFLHINENELFPAVVDIGYDKFWKLINNHFQFNNNYTTIETFDKNTVLLSTDTINYLISKKDGRERFLPLLDKTLKSPYEVYLCLYMSDKGFVEYRKHYIGLFKDNKKRNYYIIVKEKKDSFVVWNALPAKNIDNYRRGYLLYAKGT